MVQDLSYNLCESLVENINGVVGATSRKVVVATPVITLTDNSVTITCDTTEATIYYTLDGSTPTSGSTQYSAAFTLDSSCTIKAIAIKGGKSSAVAEESYVKPITYLTNWKIAGNSEVHGNEIWSCGEYNPTDGKYHILVQPLGGSIADIALTEPLRKVNSVTDTIEFEDNVATVTRNLVSVDMGDLTWTAYTAKDGVFRMQSNLPNGKPAASDNDAANLLSPIYNTVAANGTYAHRPDKIIGLYIQKKMLMVYDSDYNQSDSATAFTTAMDGVELIYELGTPTTELVDVPQIAEADSYTCVISPGAKAVSWSEFNGGILEFYDKIIPTDNAYIDTGYIPTVDSKFVVHIKRAMLDNCCIYSNAVQGKTDGIRFLWAGKNFCVSFGAPRKINSGLSELELNIVHEHTQYVTINGNSDTYITSVGNMYINEPLTIFSDYYNRSTSGTMAYSNGNSLYSFKIYENDVLVRDFKPCTYKGVAGLWDIVESKFYGNSNNVGTLTASNDA